MASTEQLFGSWTLIIFYSIGILYFVIRGAKKIKNMDDYAVGNIQFSPTAVGLSLAASMTSAATFVINPGFIANYGISGVISFGIVFPLGALISLVLLTKKFRKYGQSVKALSLAQWIGKRYENEKFALFFGFLSLLLITFIVLIVVAITKVLSKALNIDELYILISVVTFVFGYIMFGGANSMVYTNTIQAVIMIIVASILLFSGIEYFENGISGFIDKLAAIDKNLVTPTNPESLLFRDFFEIVFCQFIVGFAVVCQPHIITKSFLLKEESEVNKFLTVSVIVEVLFFIVVIAGLYARLTFPDLMIDGEMLKSDGIIPAYVITIFNSGFISIFIGLIVVLGLLSAGMSTLEGLIQSVSTTITSDIIKPIWGNKIKDDKWIWINKIVIIFLAVISLIISYDQLVNPKLSVGILAQNGVYAYFSAALIPIIFGIFLKNVKLYIPLTASITALAVHFTIYYILPFFVETYGISFGFFTKYLVGTVRNPGIAAAMAIVISSITAIILYKLQNKNSNNDE